jgi:hypothetical protein
MISLFTVFFWVVLFTLSITIFWSHAKTDLPDLRENEITVYVENSTVEKENSELFVSSYFYGDI